MPKRIDNSALAANHETTKECVVLLHGLGRTYRSMEEMAEALEKAGYKSINIDYPSREYPIEELAMSAVPDGILRCDSAGVRTIHFVTHSMGGMLLRYYLGQTPLKELGRVVMLSPPNQGSELSDALIDTTAYEIYNGPAGQQLGTGPKSIIHKLGPVDYPVGIITGNEHAFFDTWFADMIPGENDGKVSVERAKVAGMTDFLVLPYAHPYIMKEAEVITQTIHFLRHGNFQKDGSLQDKMGVGQKNTP